MERNDLNSNSKTDVSKHARTVCTISNNMGKMPQEVAKMILTSKNDHFSGLNAFLQVKRQGFAAKSADQIRCGLVRLFCENYFLTSILGGRMIQDHGAAREGLARPGAI